MLVQEIHCQLLLDGVAFVPCCKHRSKCRTRSFCEVRNNLSTVNWGIDGNKALAVSIRDSAEILVHQVPPFVVTVDKTAYS